MVEADAKKLFAEALLRMPGRAFEAGVAVYGLDTGSALRASMLWVNDPAVIAHQSALLEEHGLKHFLPTKDEFALKLFNYAETLHSPEDKLKAYRLSAEVMGYIERPSIINNNIVDQRRVMVVPSHGTDSEWEVMAAQSQQKLLSDAAAGSKEKARTVN